MTGSSSIRLQLAALPLLDPDHIQSEKIALQKHFKAKRDHVLARLHDLGMDVKVPPVSTFYVSKPSFTLLVTFRTSD